MPERISSLHDDAAHIFNPLPEYDQEKGHPHTYPDLGEKGERSILARIAQFGITETDLEAVGVKNFNEMTNEQFDKLMTEAVAKQYETLFVSVYGRWTEMTLEEQRQLVNNVSSRYKDWGMRFQQDNITQAPRLVTSLEGADFVRSLDDLDIIYNSGIRSIIIQYNKPNHLADQNGLTDLGKKFVVAALRRGINVDLAHSNPNTRQGIFKVAKDLGLEFLLSYSHGASVDDMKKDLSFASVADNRGLREDEIVELVKNGGIIGLGVSRPFFSSIDQLVSSIDHVCQKENGPKSLGLGTDFGGVSPTMLLKEIKSVKDLAIIGERLAVRFGYSEAQIKAILSKNITEWSKKLAD